MNVNDLAPEVAQSCLEMAIALSQAAQSRDDLYRTAAFVHHCYVRAVTPVQGERTHELRWRRFIVALSAYLERCPASPVTLKLASIVRENADLLERETALAS